MISPIELKEFLGTAGADFSEDFLQEAITLAELRFKKLTNREPMQDNPIDRKAITLLSAIEVANQVNLYYRKDVSEIIRVKDLAAEVERLLSITPKRGLLVWQTL